MQIILFHFSVSDLPGISGTANTALTALPRLHKEGFINANAICGRQNSRQVKIEVCFSPSSLPVHKHTCDSSERCAQAVVISFVELDVFLQLHAGPALAKHLLLASTAPAPAPSARQSGKCPSRCSSSRSATQLLLAGLRSGAPRPACMHRDKSGSAAM